MPARGKTTARNDSSSTIMPKSSYGRRKVTPGPLSPTFIEMIKLDPQTPEFVKKVVNKIYKRQKKNSTSQVLLN